MKRLVRMICWLFIAILLGLSERAMAQPDKDFVSRLIMSSGGAVGNGGGTIVCRNPDRSIRSIEVLDLFEARVLRKNPTDLESFAGDWRAKVRAVIERLGKVSVLREKIYSDWLASFEEEAMVLEGVDFNNIPDTMNIGIPKGCEFVQVAVQIMPRFTGDHRYYLNGEYWRAMDDTQKAALVLHEIVYREALSYGHTDSVATRYFMGLIVSPKILAEDSWSIVSTLKQVRFEQTDVPLEYADIETEFTPVNWWRSFYDNEGLDPNRKEKPKAIPLKGRMVINVGYCKNSGCTDWKSYGAEKGVQTFSCSGLSAIRIGDDVISVPVPIYEASGGAAVRCDRRVRYAIDHELAAPVQIEYLREKSSGKRPTGRRFKNTLTLSEEMTAYHFAYERMMDGRYERRAVETDTFFTPLVNGYSEANEPLNHCFVEILFKNRKISEVMTSEGEVPFSECRYVIENKVGGFGFTYSFTERDEHIRFDDNGLYSSGGAVSHIFSAPKVPEYEQVSYYYCEDPVATCFIASSVTNGIPASLVARKGALAHIPGNDSNCKLAEGSIELYPNLLPKQLSLAEACELKTVAGSSDKFPAGSVLRLSEDGKVIEKVQ